MILAGVDLAWQSEKNPSAIAIGNLTENVLTIDEIQPAIYGFENVFKYLDGIDRLIGISIDAPLIINNQTGQRACEKGIGKTYGSRHASCHTSNTKLYPNAKSVQLSTRLSEYGFNHLDIVKWQIECYPHPAIIEIFGLPERLKYKKGRVSEKKIGQHKLATLIQSLGRSQILKIVFNNVTNQILDRDFIESLQGKSLKSNEDALDSILCLYISGLYAINHAGNVFGNVDSGYIWVPHKTCI
jgi:predicted RNase H-like nuclease